MPAVFQQSLVVTESDIDELGHVNNLVYLKWMLQAAVAHSAAQGWPAQAYQELGAGWVVRSHQIEYLQPGLLGNHVVVRTWVSDMKKVTSLRRYRILRMDQTAGSPSRETVLAVAATDWAFIGFQTRFPKRIPPEVSSAFEIVSEEGVGGRS